MNDIPVKWFDKPFHSLDFDFKTIYGQKVYKIAIDAGMTCPNRDGTIDTRGCIFCSEGGSGDFASKVSTSITEQIEEGKKVFTSDKIIGNKFIAYFQAYTNTYASIDYLAKIYEEALAKEDIIGISIATRADCIYESTISLLADLKSKYSEKFIWVELGLQSIHPATVDFIRRGYANDMFENAVQALSSIDIPIITHVILGLPGESKQMMLDTCDYLNKLPISGIKLQLLHVLKNTDLADIYLNNGFKTLSLEEYIDIVVSCVEILSPNITIHRLTGDGPKDLLIAPTWSLNKRNVLNSILREFKQRNTWQGKYYST